MAIAVTDFEALNNFAKKNIILTNISSYQTILENKIFSKDTIEQFKLT